MSLIRGRFQKPVDSLVAAYTGSISFDARLYPYDIAGSVAHARMLGQQGIITPAEAEQIISGLLCIQGEIDEGKLHFKPELEDIHMNIEATLISEIGEVGRKLHTARSRNDQIALDMRLFVKDAVVDVQAAVRRLQRALLSLAAANRRVVMPGYTHLQRAQPVLFAHHLLAYFEMLERDYERFAGCWQRADVMPLGSGALAGVAYKVDPDMVARELGFGRVSRNSLDAVSDRDFVIEFESVASMCMMHLSRLAEEIVIWSSAEFDFVELDDAYTTGSSIMPQKKNPVVAELARGKTGRVYGHLFAMLTTMKALPLTYNMDLQEDKEGLFDTVDTIMPTLDVLAGMIGTMKVKPDRMKKLAGEGYILATDLADYLVKKGVAFRTAHEAVGKLVSYAIEKGRTLRRLRLDEYRQFSPQFDEDVFSTTVASSLAARDSPGGTAPRQVARALAAARKTLGGASSAGGS